MWLGEDLHVKYNDYTNDLEKYTKQYKEFISDWSAAYNEYSDLMNYVPAEPRVMLIGDVFEKLYCVYNKYKPASKEFKSELTYYKYDTETLTYQMASPQNDQDLKAGQYYVIQDLGIEDGKDPVQFLVERLQTKLDTYKVDQEDDKTRSPMAKTDDVLLTLENDASDSVTIRVRYTASDTSDKPDKISYRVFRTLTMASTGISNTIEYSLYDWVDGQLTANKFGLEDDYIAQPFRIKSIGTLGAYFCLVRDETEKSNLEDYGIRLLQEKQDTYTKIFITQTEGYLNKEGSQCVTSNEEPKGNEYPVGTKWLDTNDTKPNGSLIMKIRTDSGWVEYTPDDNDYENYARFYENYAKLGNVQSVLSDKQLQADYLLNGIAFNAMRLSNKDINLNNLLRVAIMHFIVLENEFIISIEQPTGNLKEGTVWVQTSNMTTDVVFYQYINKEWKIFEPRVNLELTEYNKEFGFITFKVASDKNNEYAVYVINGIPYVSYSHSQGLCLAKMNVLKEASDMNNYFNEQELMRLSPFIREDEYSDDNFLLTGYESEEEQMNIKQELLNAGEEELKKICQPKLSFDATMANILAIPEFAPLKNQFKLGNFVRVGIRDGYVKRARLLEVNINFDDPSDFSCVFGDLLTTKSEVDKHADLLSMAVTAGKSVASNSSNWQKGADKATELDRRINDGLKDAALSVGAADGQAITWDSSGIWGRKLANGTTDQYEPEQFRLINNKLVFSSDGFKTSKAVFGKYTINGEERWGPLAEYITAETIEGKFITGGSIRIGGNKPGDRQFIVHEDGSVEIGTVVQEGDNTKIQSEYVSQEALNQIDSAYKYNIQIIHTGKAVFSSKDDDATLTAEIYRRGKPATENFKKAGVVVHWEKNPSQTGWSPTYVESGNSYSITLKSEDVQNSAQISCYIDPNEAQIQEIENNYND